MCTGLHRLPPRSSAASGGGLTLKKPAGGAYTTWRLEAAPGAGAPAPGADLLGLRVTIRLEGRVGAPYESCASYLAPASATSCAVTNVTLSATPGVWVLEAVKGATGQYRLRANVSKPARWLLAVTCTKKIIACAQWHAAAPHLPAQMPIRLSPALLMALDDTLSRHEQVDGFCPVCMSSLRPVRAYRVSSSSDILPGLLEGCRPDCCAGRALQARPAARPRFLGALKGSTDGRTTFCPAANVGLYATADAAADTQVRVAYSNQQLSAACLLLGLREACPLQATAEPAMRKSALCAGGSNCKPTCHAFLNVASRLAWIKEALFRLPEAHT